MKAQHVKRKLVAGVVTVAAVAGGGAAIAATQDSSPTATSSAIVADAASQLGIQSSALTSALQKAEDNQTAYIVRSLLSEGRIEYPTVVRDEDGTLHTVKLIKEGPTNLITTTTSISLHGENETYAPR